MFLLCGSQKVRVASVGITVAGACTVVVLARSLVLLLVLALVLVV